MQEQQNEQNVIDLKDLVSLGATRMKHNEDGSLSFRYRGKSCTLRTLDPEQALTGFVQAKLARDEELARMPLTTRALEEAGFGPSDYAIQGEFSAIVRDPRGKVRDSLVLAYNEKGYLAEVELLKRRLNDD